MKCRLIEDRAPCLIGGFVRILRFLDCTPVESRGLESVSLVKASIEFRDGLQPGTSPPSFIPWLPSRSPPQADDDPKRREPEPLPQRHTRPDAYQDGRDHHEQHDDPHNGGNTLEGISGLHDAQHEPESRQNERDHCERSREGHPPMHEVRSVHGATLLSPRNMRYRFPLKQPRSVSARIPVPSNRISAGSPPAAKYAVQNDWTASFRCAESGAKSLLSRRPRQSGTPCNVKPCCSRRCAARSRARPGFASEPADTKR